MKMQNWIGIAVLVLIAWVGIIQLDVLNIYDFLSHQPDSKTTDGVFTPKETGAFPISDISNGQVFLVSLQEVTPYANGYKLTFHIGNTSLVEYAGVSLIYGWGENMGSLSQPETVKIIKPLLPGLWNKVTIIAAPAKKEDLERIVLSIDAGAGTMSLKNDFRK